MLRLISKALVALALLGGPALAQSFTLPEIGLQNSGPCRQLAARDRSNNAMVALGCLDTASHAWRFSGDASTMSVTPPGSAAATVGDLLRYVPTIDGSSNVGLLNGMALGKVIGGLFQSTPGSMSISAAPQMLTAGMTGNPGNTLSNVNVQVANGSATVREAAGIFGINVLTPCTLDPVADKAKLDAGACDKIGLYSGIYAAQGSYNSFGGNTLAAIAPGNTNFAGHWAWEFDLENLGAHTGETVGPDGLKGQISRGIDITGSGQAGSKRSTAAMTIGVPPNRLDIFNRGIALTGGIVQEDIGSYTHSARFLRDWGQHGVGLDLSSATYAEAAIKLGNGHAIQALTSGGLLAPLMYLRSDNYIIHGGANALGDVFLNPLFAPALPTSAGTVKGTVCIDTTGAIYVKTTSGACL